jgi:ferrous iron transport protein B
MNAKAILEKMLGMNSCDGGIKADPSAQQIIIVGTPNVGKSALFNRLTGRYVTVSNYPGTTVEVSRGKSRYFGAGIEVVDTPGMYSLLPVSEEERVARDILFERAPKAVLHVIDAKNIQRMLGLTLQLAQAGLPLVLVLNMADEAQELGIEIDIARLGEMLGIPVVATVATTGKGVRQLAAVVRGLDGRAGAISFTNGEVLENAISQIAAKLPPRNAMPARTRAMLLLEEDAQERAILCAEMGEGQAGPVLRAVSRAKGRLGQSPHHDLAMAIKANVDAVLADTVIFPAGREEGFRERLSRFCMNPWTGLPLLAVVLYFGLYQFVGKFGAGTCVDFLEKTVFKQYVVDPLNDGAAKVWVPWLAAHVSWFPWGSLADLFVGDYGIITLGVRYAVAIILPVVGSFFLAFSILEDSGYLPRLAMLVDRVFKKIGLNGRAVIPMVLGFGCDTMATMVTRTLETKRERVIATLLLSLAIPCSAQLGLITGLLSHRPAALAVWVLMVTGIFLLVGLLAAKVLPGERASFYMELPPLRMPRLTNVLVKTYTRIAWYFKEILPMFIIASVLIWIGRLTFWGLLPKEGVFGLVINGLHPVMRALGLPLEAAESFLFGFFRRDYGTGFLFDLQSKGKLAGNQLVVAAITLTLFLPCIAQFMVMKKERGWKVTLLMSAFICVVAFSVGAGVNAILNALGAVGVSL